MSALGSGITKLQNIIGYKFYDVETVGIALSHPGLGKSSGRDFERLEFLGDRVIGLSLSSLLYKLFPKDSEGDLAVRISVLAGTDFLINIAKKTKIADCFLFPKDFFLSDNKNSSAIADMTEAVFGAVFLDSNFETAMSIVTKLWKNDISDAIHKKKDSKSLLQEISQAGYSELPVYRLVRMSGEAHNPIFEIEVTACGTSAVGCGNSKKNAERDAADKLISKTGGAM
jgi:ribonuclease-3